MAKLGDICNILDSQRKPVSKSNRQHGDYPYYGANGIQDYVDKYLFDGEYLLLGEDGSVINKDNTPVINWAKGKIWVNNHAHVLSENKEKASLRYIYHALHIIDVSDIVRGVPPKINQANMRDIEIPLPSLSEQQRIVNILDKFEGMVENVEKELLLRQKQYEFYREKMINSRNTKSLDNYVVFAKDRISANELNADNYVSVENLIKNKGGKTVSDSVPTTSNWIRYDKGDILIGNIRPYLRKIWLADRTGGTNGDVIVIRSKDKEKYMPEYIYELLADDAFFVFYSATVKDDNMPRGAKEKVFEYKVAIPSLDKQQEIVAKLDKFEELIANLKEELELRKKQYEYYREKLLTFE